MEGVVPRWWPGWVPVAVDALIVFFVHLGSLLVRLEGKIPQEYWRSFLAFISLVVVIYVVGNIVARGYERDALRRVPPAALVSVAVVFAVGAFWTGPLRPMPISVTVLGAVLSMFGFVGVRLVARKPRVKA